MHCCKSRGRSFEFTEEKRNTVEYTEYRDWYVALIFYKLLVLSFAEFKTYSLVKICMTNEQSCMHFWEMHIFVHLCEDTHGFLRNTQCAFRKYTYLLSSMKICMHLWEVHRVPSHMENWRIAYTANMHALFSGWKQKRAPASGFCAFRWRVGAESQKYYKVRKCTVEIQFPFRKKMESDMNASYTIYAPNRTILKNMHENAYMSSVFVYWVQHCMLRAHDRSEKSLQ